MFSMTVAERCREACQRVGECASFSRHEFLQQLAEMEEEIRIARQQTRIGMEAAEDTQANVLASAEIWWAKHMAKVGMGSPSQLKDEEAFADNISGSQVSTRHIVHQAMCNFLMYAYSHSFCCVVCLGNASRTHWLSSSAHSALTWRYSWRTTPTAVCSKEKCGRWWCRVA